MDPNHPWLKPLSSNGPLLMANRSTNSQLRKDRQMLEREVKAINATLYWERSGCTLTIQIDAPDGFTWVATGSSMIYHTTENLGPTWVRDTMAEILNSMKYGYDGRLTHAKHEDTCECDECENWDEDLDELRF
jgi:hypothetical protein